MDARARPERTSAGWSSSISGLGPRRSSNPHTLMTRRRKAEGDRSVNEADPCLRSSRARATTPSVDAPMNSTSLTSTMTPAVPTAMARASVRHSAPSFETSCSPQSRMTIGPISDPPGHEGDRSETVKKEGPTRAMVSSYLRHCEGRVTRVWSTAPASIALAQHVGDFVVPARTVHVLERRSSANRTVARRRHGLAIMAPLTVGRPRRRGRHGLNTRREAPARLGTPACAGAVCRRPKQVMSKRRVGVTNGRTSLFVGAPEGTLPVSRFCPNSPGAINDHLPVGQERPEAAEIVTGLPPAYGPGRPVTTLATSGNPLRARYRDGVVEGRKAELLRRQAGPKWRTPGYRTQAPQS